MPNQNQLTQSTLNFSPKAPQATRSDSTIRPSPPGRRSKLDLVHGNARPAPTPLVDLTGPFDVYCGTTSSPSKREQPPATMEKHANGRSAVINLTEASESTSSPRTLAAAANSGAALRAKLEHLTCAAGKKRPANEALLGAPTRPFEIAGKKRVPFGSASSKPTEALETAVNARSTLVAEKDGSVTMRSLAQARGNSQTSWSETQTRKTVNASTRSTSSARVLPSSFRSKGSSLSGSAEAPDVKLSPEQEHVAHLVINQKESLFFTGSAGTGKSVLLRKMIARLRKLHREEEIAITAPTGIAACNIGGCTLHSFAGCGLANAPVEKLLVQMNQKARQRWRSTRVLIIDEISMVDGVFFDKLESIARNLLDGNRPFGGIQLVLCGDFMQLPPVSKGSKFAFESQSWSRCVRRTLRLKRVFRQQDETFVRVLNEMRMGIVSEESERLLKSLSRPISTEDGLVPTQLFAVRTQVESANMQRLAQLPGAEYRYRAVDVGNPSHLPKLKDVMAPEVLTLKIGAQVMLTKNLSDALVNGTLGIVAEINKESKAPIVEFRTIHGPLTTELEKHKWSIESGNSVDPLCSREQYPLILAYALSIHKSQGQTLERVTIDLSKCFETGQAYVAISRATHLEGLQVLNFSRAKVMADSRVARFHQSLESLV